MSKIKRIDDKDGANVGGGVEHLLLVDMSMAINSVIRTGISQKAEVDLLYIQLYHAWANVQRTLYPDSKILVYHVHCCSIHNT